MPCICYTPDRRFTRQWREMIAIANHVLEEREGGRNMQLPGGLRR